MPILRDKVIGEPLANLAALKALTITGKSSGVLQQVISMTPYGGFFAWNSTSTATADDINVVLPTGHVGAGRWIRQDFSGIKVGADGSLIMGVDTGYGIDQAEADVTFYATFAQQMNGNYGLGSLTATTHGTPAINNGWLDLSAGSSDYIYFNGVGNANRPQKGTIKFKYKPLYTTAPATTQTIYEEFLSSAPSDNALVLAHADDGTVTLSINNSDGTPAVADYFGTWNPVSGTEYELALNYDGDTGSHKFMIDGITLGTLTGTFTRTNNIDVMKIGDSSHSYFSMSDYVSYNAVKYTGDYTPGYSLIEQPITISNANSILQDLDINGALGLAQTTSSGKGAFYKDGVSFFHTYGGVESDNMFFGWNAGNFNVIGVNNLGMATNALKNLYDGNYNCFYGIDGGMNIVHGTQNGGFGPVTLPNLVDGNGNWVFGYAAGISYTGSESYNLLWCNSGVTGESRVIRIGTHGSGAGEQNKFFPAGVYDTAIGATVQPVAIDSSYQLGASNFSYHPVTSGITAHAGGGQADATQLTTEINFVDTVATGNDSVKLPVAVKGMLIIVSCNDFNAVNIYPQSGSYINGGLNTPYLLVGGTAVMFSAIDTTHWRSVGELP